MGTLDHASCPPGLKEAVERAKSLKRWFPQDVETIRSLADDSFNVDDLDQLTARAKSAGWATTTGGRGKGYGSNRIGFGLPQPVRKLLPAGHRGKQRTLFVWSKLRAVQSEIRPAKKKRGTRCRVGGCSLSVERWAEPARDRRTATDAYGGSAMDRSVRWSAAGRTDEKVAGGVRGYCAPTQSVPSSPSPNPNPTTVALTLSRTGYVKTIQLSSGGAYLVS